MRSQPRLLPVLGLLGGLACGPDELPELGSQAWVGDHLEVWTTEDVQICEGSFGLLDDHAREVRRFAEDRGVETRLEKYRYYWIDRGTLERDSPCESAACFFSRGPSVYASQLLVHEVVHAEVIERHHSFFEEGLADLLGDDQWRHTPRVVDVAAEIDRAAGETLDRTLYREAADLTRLAFDLYPDEALAALVDTSRDDDYAGTRERLAAHGLDLDELVATHGQAESCSMDGVRIALTECATEPTAWQDADTWLGTGALDCDATDTFGPSPDETPEMWTIRALEIAEAGDYSLWMDGAEGTTARLVACDRTRCEPLADNIGGEFALVSPESIAYLTLRPGRYWIRIARPLEKGPEPGFSVHLNAGWDWAPD